MARASVVLPPPLRPVITRNLPDSPCKFKSFKKSSFPPYAGAKKMCIRDSDESVLRILNAKLDAGILS